MEITRETMQALAERMAKNVGRLLAWQVQDRLNAAAQVGGSSKDLPKMGETFVRGPTDDERLAGVRAILVRKISARYYLRVVAG